MITLKDIENKIKDLQDALLTTIDVRGDLIATNVYSVRDEIVKLKSTINDANLTISDLHGYINILLQFITEKYDRGTIIIYDEHNPRSLTLIKNGKIIDTSHLQSMTFYFNANEFPTITIDE